MTFASFPTATTWPVFSFRVTTDGSLMTMPRPRTYTSVFAVPKSMPMSLEKSELREKRFLAMMLLRSCREHEELLARDEPGIAGAAVRGFYLARLERALTDDDAGGDADKVGVRELFACARIAV